MKWIAFPNLDATGGKPEQRNSTVTRLRRRQGRQSVGGLLFGLLGLILWLGGHSCLAAAAAGTASGGGNTEIPLPEHPRPDFERPDWINLNGTWEFRFDAENRGLEQEWSSTNVDFPERIRVPFPWGSKLSGVEDRADIGWYRRSIRIPEEWRNRRVFLVVGACDWQTTVWINGRKAGDHQGGYTPFEFDITPHLESGANQSMVLRVDDSPRPFKLEGKQGYGRAAGIWQTVYLEARPESALHTLHFLPDLAGHQVHVRAAWNQPAPPDSRLEVQFRPEDRPAGSVSHDLTAGSRNTEFPVVLSNIRRWDLEDPYLYEITARLVTPNGTDTVASYFGMREIGVTDLPGSDIPYVSLNGRPVYLQMTLDQAYHPEGYYTFPSDDFMRGEILRTRRLGLNAQRIHVKVGIPRKLYWADRLGVLIMADVPNSWGEPGPQMRAESEYALRGMIHRDFNHPAIFSWVNFNETWGLTTRTDTDQNHYLPETRQWVASIYRLTKKLDPTRLVEDNSPNKFDHVATDLNTWHAYLPGYEWRSVLDEYCEKTYPGSTWNFIGDRRQDRQPMMNSECGNVWGYRGSTGDVDWSWDYHIMINEFRRHPKVCGWLYTEHHDVINEWNGYYRYDRTTKDTGMHALVSGMQLNDLHAPYYVAVGRELCREVEPGASVAVPLFASFLGDNPIAGSLHLEYRLHGWNSLGQAGEYDSGTRPLSGHPWTTRELDPLNITMPNHPAVAVLAVRLVDPTGYVRQRNFTTFLVASGPSPRHEVRRTPQGKFLRLLRFAPDSFHHAEWSAKQWNVLEGLKVNGAGSGFFEYRIPWPADLDPDSVESATFLMEASAKRLLGKDRESDRTAGGDFMRGRGTHDPASNPNAYPMTDESLYPSAVRVRSGRQAAAVITLPDDPADHRGILSWHSQKRDRRLREAGSYGYLVQANLPPESLHAAAGRGFLTLRLEVDAALPGGLAIYGERFGRYPLDPTLALLMK